MIEGYVTESLEPIVEIGLRRADATTQIPATVDTGFSGFLCLAQRHADRLEMSFQFVERYELANGEIIPTDVFQGNIEFDGREQPVELIVTASDDTLIGASLLRDFELRIDYPMRTVRIENRRTGMW